MIVLQAKPSIENFFYSLIWRYNSCFHQIKFENYELKVH
ncbi:hypothetical protein NIES4103_16520 [Nostoc sp. NIES-4103]|nr:hypothetical protein NIES4103_16520 [Nostoc sp. NIES-4103]